jgi:hypothetical protein
MTLGVPRAMSNPPQAMAPQLEQRAPGAGWIFAYLAVQITCQLALLVPGLGVGRSVARSLAFGISLLFLLVIPGRPLTKHPVRAAVGAILIILSFSALNPEGGGAIAVIAHFSFHLAIVAPVFWVARLRIREKSLETLLVTLWAFSTASAVVGVLQAYFPGRFQPTAGLLGMEEGRKHFSALLIRLASGEFIPRPTGLTDAPGGAAAGGFYAVLLAVGVAVARPFPFARLAAAFGAVAGMTCLYLCQIRAAIVMLGMSLLAVFGVFALAGRLSRSVLTAAAAAALIVVAFFVAYSLGGDTVTGRLETLVAADASTVYYNARGRYLASTFTERLPEYPLGAGLGRWGMINFYFANGERALWAEIQWSGWLYDGGLLLLLAYPIAILVALRGSFNVALQRTTERLEIWAAVVAGYNLGTFALTFSYHAFMSTTGIEFWVLNAALIQASAPYLAARSAPAAIPARFS